MVWQLHVFLSARELHMWLSGGECNYTFSLSMADECW